MSLHTESGSMAHNLDRFDFGADFELVAAEAAIIETLLTAYPGHAILGEESGGSLPELR